MNQNALEIQNELAARDIFRLCHFTQIRNLEGIFTVGALLPRTRLQRHPELKAAYNDQVRFEGAHVINLSFTCPNIKLMKKFEREHREKGFDTSWAIIDLNPKLCCAPGVRFTTSNATANNVRKFGTAEGIAGLRACFAERVPIAGGTAIRIANRAKNLPTDSQAEVLYPGPIPLNCIQGLYFKDETDQQRAVATLSPLMKRLREINPERYQNLSIRAYIFPEIFR